MAWASALSFSPAAEAAGTYPTRTRCHLNRAIMYSDEKRYPLLPYYNEASPSVELILILKFDCGSPRNAGPGRSLDINVHSVSHAAAAATAYLETGRAGAAAVSCTP